MFLEIIGDRCADVGVNGEGRALSGVLAIIDGWPGRLNKKDRKYLGFTIVDADARVDIERATGVAYTGLRFASRILVSLRLVSLRLASREINGGPINRDDDDSADDGEELSRKHHGVG